MRLSLVYETKEIPRPYGLFMVSLIKESLKKYDEELYNELYNESKVKAFTFAVHLSGFEMQYKKIKINNSITLNLSCADFNVAVRLFSCLSRLKKYECNGYTLNLKNVYIENDNKINDEEVRFKTLSPLLVKNKDNKYITIENEEYVDYLNYCTNFTLEILRGHGLKRRLEFIGLNIKKQNVKIDINSKNVLLSCDAIEGEFILKGDAEDLNYIAAAGLGNRRSQGFGCIKKI